VGNLVSLQARLPRPERVPRGGPLPLSPAQERLWYLCRFDPGTAYYNVPLAWRLRGPLDRAALERSLAAMAERHEILRTGFPEREGAPVAAIHPPFRVELEGGDPGVFVRRPFDLERGPLWRAGLFEESPDGPLLACVFHQIVFDGASMRIWTREMAEFYRAFAAGAGPNLPEMRLQYADFADWKRRVAQGEVLEAHRAYWREKMRAPYQPLALPSDRPCGAADIGPGARVPCAVPGATAARLTRAAAQGKTTLFAAFMTALKMYLHSLTGQRDLMVFASAADRGDPALAGIIGLLANVLPVRTDLGGARTFRECLERVGESCVDAMAWQGLPLAAIMEHLPPGPARPYQVMLIYHGAPLPAAEAAGLRFDPSHELDHGCALFDLLFELTNTRDEIRGHIKYRADAFEEATVRRLWAGFLELLDAAASDPERLAVTAPPAPQAQAARPAAREFVPARDPLEERLAEWCAESLGVGRLGIRDNFFDLGGDSLAAVRMLRAVESRTGLSLSPTVLLDAPTVELLAEELRRRGCTGPLPSRAGGWRGLRRLFGT